MNRQLKGNVILLITAVIWGFGFVAQSSAMQYVRPFTFTSVRYIIGCLVLIPVVLIFRRRNNAYKQSSPAEKKILNKTTVTGGICCGIALAAATSFQQFGVSMTTAGKAGFITALYIIIIPIIGIFFKKKVRSVIWICAVIALAGFYLLCINEGLSVGLGDLLCLICAFLFSIQIILIDHFVSKNADCILMSCIEFLTAGLIAGVLMFIFESPTWGALWEARFTILYAGVLSSGVAYTLQVVGQSYTKPAIASLIMSLEAVFGAIGGWLLLHEVLSLKELLGCLLVFAAVILAQIPLPSKK